MKAQTVDPMAAALDAASHGRPGQKSRIAWLFADRPAVLESIRRARDRNISFAMIADAISTADQPVSPGAVKTWLDSDKRTR